MLHLLPLLFGIPSHKPFRPLREPFTTQQLLPKQKDLICISDLPVVEVLEWFHLVGRHRRHDTNKRFLCVLIGNLLVREREWSEPLVLTHHDVRVIHLMAFWFLRLEKVEVETPYQVDELGIH